MEACERLEMVSVKNLRHDGGTQSRKKRDDDLIADYAAAMATDDGRKAFPPLRVVYDKKTRSFWIWDGHHRKLAAVAAKVKEFQCLVRDATQEEAIWLGASANKEHGLRRSNEDKEKAVHDALRLRPQMSDRVIAEHVGVDYKTVATHRDKMESGGEIPRLTTRTGADGKAYDTTKTGAPSKARGAAALATTTASTLTPDAAPGHRPKLTREHAHEDFETGEDEYQQQDDQAEEEPGNDLVEDGAMAEPGTPTHSVDELGHRLPPDVAPIFTALQLRLAGIARLLEQGAREWAEFQRADVERLHAAGTLRGDVLGALGPALGVLLHLRENAGTLKHALPYAVCPYCKAFGTACLGCKGTGYVSKSTYEAAPAEDRQ